MAVVFWDFDGTLVYSNPLWSNSVYSSLKAVCPNTKVTFADVRKCMKTGFTWHTPNEDYTQLIGNKWWQFTIEKIRNDYISLGIDEKTAFAAASNVPSIIKKTENYHLYPDTISALEISLKSGNINVLLSNNYPDLEQVVHALDLNRYFDKLIISALVGYDKPRTELFELAKSFYPNEDYIMIGDNPNADILGGKAAGMKTILVHNGYDENADFCVENLSDIKF